MRVRVREVFLKRTSKTFVIANVLLLAWAAAGIVLAVDFERRKRQDRKVRFLQKSMGFDLIAVTTTFFSSGVLIAVGIMGLLGSIVTKPVVLSSYRGALTCSVTLKISAFAWAGSIHPLPRVDKYVKQFKLEALHLQSESNCSRLWQKPVLFWDIIQKELHCCGVNEFQDWIYSDCKCLPMSCCITSNEPSCKSVYNEQFNLGLDVDQLLKIKSITRLEGCMKALRSAMIQAQKSLIAHTLLSLAIEVILYTLCCHLLKMIEHHMMKPVNPDSEDDERFALWLLESNESLFGIAPPKGKVKDVTDGKPDGKNVNAEGISRTGQAATL